MGLGLGLGQILGVELGLGLGDVRTSVNHSLNRVQLGMTFCQYDAWQTGLPSAPRRAATKPVCTWLRLGLEG